MSSESGASALDARINPTIVGPQPVTAGLAELGPMLQKTPNTFIQHWKNIEYAEACTSAPQAREFWRFWAVSHAILTIYNA